MSKKITELKWEAVKSGDGYADVITSEGTEIYTVWSTGGGLDTANQIASDHNAQLGRKSPRTKIALS